MLAAHVPAPANTECSSSESDHEAAPVASICQAAQGSYSANPEHQPSPNHLGRAGSPEKEGEMS